MSQGTRLECQRGKRPLLPVLGLCVVCALFLWNARARVSASALRREARTARTARRLCFGGFALGSGPVSMEPRTVTPLSRTDAALIRFLNLPFALVMPVLLAIIAGMVWTFSHYTLPANAFSVRE